LGLFKIVLLKGYIRRGQNADFWGVENFGRVGCMFGRQYRALGDFWGRVSAPTALCLSLTFPALTPSAREARLGPHWANLWSRLRRLDSRR